MHRTTVRVEDHYPKTLTGFSGGGVQPPRPFVALLVQRPVIFKESRSQIQIKLTELVTKPEIISRGALHFIYPGVSGLLRWFVLVRLLSVSCAFSARRRVGCAYFIFCADSILLLILIKLIL